MDYRTEQQRPGYVAGIKRNRKIVNKRLRSLDVKIKEHLSMSADLNFASGEIRRRINGISKSGFLRRLAYAVTGNMRHLLLIADAKNERTEKIIIDPNLVALEAIDVSASGEKITHHVN